MKKALLLFAIIILFNFSGCKNSTINSTEQNEIENSIPDNAGKTIVTTSYYKIEIPTSWETDCFYELSETKDHTLSFYDKASYEETNEGRLFSIKLLPSSEDYLIYPEYEVLGSVELKENDAYNVVVLYPTDVQFSENTVIKYNELTKAIPDILKTISFNDNCVFSKEPIPVIVPEETMPGISKKFIGKWNDTGMGLRAPDGAKWWNVEFREDGTGTFEFIFEADDVVCKDFVYEPFDTYLGETMDGILIKRAGAADVPFMVQYGWSNELQKMLMTMYEVQNNGTPNLDVYWVFANN